MSPLSAVCDLIFSLIFVISILNRTTLTFVQCNDELSDNFLIEFTILNFEKFDCSRIMSKRNTIFKFPF